MNDLSIINENDSMHEILNFYRKKPDISYRHIECNYLATDGEHHVDFTYKTHKNFGNSIHSTMHTYRLYIDTRKATENDLRRLL